jgi:uncharacterized membrane protein
MTGADIFCFGLNEYVSNTRLAYVVEGNLFQIYKFAVPIFLLILETIQEFSFHMLNFHQNFLNLDIVIICFTFTVILPALVKGTIDLNIMLIVSCTLKASKV